MNKQFSLFAEAPPIERLLVVLLPDPKTAERVALRAHELRKQHALRAKPLETSRFHLTLHHLGNYPTLPKEIIAAASVVGQSLRFAPFDITLDHAMTLDNGGSRLPFVLTGDSMSALKKFHQTLSHEMKKAGLGRWTQFSFTPHMTLLYDEERVEKHPIEPITWVARELVLLHSEHGNTKHNVEGRWPLGS